MLEKAKARNVQVDWRKGTAEELPLEDGSADGVTASFTLHHWTNLEAAFGEIHRVLRPGGRLVILTSTPEQMKGYWLNKYFPQMMQDSMRQMPSYEVVTGAMEAAGLVVEGVEKYFIREDLEDWFLYSGKHDPTRYLDPGVRMGISSFSDLARQEEVRDGLSKLDADLHSRVINRVMDEYKNDKGDYLFIVGRKAAHPAPPLPAQAHP
jgi:SAM-dependent methyltransferase